MADPNPYSQFEAPSGGGDAGPAAGNPYAQFEPQGVAAGPPEPQSSGTDVAKQFGYGLAPGVVGGILDLPGFLSNIILNPQSITPGGVKDIKTGENVPKLVDVPQGYGSDLVRAGMDKIGLNPGEPKNAVERAALAAGAGVVPGAAAGFMSGGPVGGLVGAVGGALYGAGTSAVREVVPEDFQPLYDVGTMLAPFPVKRAAEAVGDVTLATKAAQRRNAARTLDELATDPLAARRPPAPDFEATFGVPPTTAQATGDAGLAAGERALRTTGSKATQEALAARDAASRAAQGAALAGVEPGSATALPEGLRTAQAARSADIDVLEAENRARAANAGTALPGGGATPETIGGRLRGAVETRHKDLRDAENTAWDAVRENPFEVAGDDAQAVIAKVYSGLTPEARLGGTDAGMTAFEDRLQDIALGRVRKDGTRTGGYSGTTLDSQRLIDLRKQVGAALETATGPERARLSQVYGGLADLLRTTAESAADPAVRGLIDAANTASRAKFSFQDAPVVSAALRRTPESGLGVLDATLPEKAFTPGAKGAETVQALVDAVGPETAMPILRESAGASLRRAAERPDGSIDPVRFEQWRRKHADALRAMPEMDVAFRDAASASTALDEIAGLRRELVDQRNQGAIARVMRAETPETVTAEVGNILSRRDAPEQMRTLATEARAAGPDAVAGLRRAVADHFTQKLEEAQKSGKPGDFLRDLARPATESALRAAGWSASEIGMLRQIGAQLALSEKLASSKGVRNRAAEALGDPNAGKVNWRQEIVASGGAGVGTGLAALLSSLIPGFNAAAIGAIGATLGTALVRAIHRRGIRNARELVESAMLDPQEARALLAVIRAPNESSLSFMLRTQKDRALFVPIGAGAEGREPSKETAE